MTREQFRIAVTVFLFGFLFVYALFSPQFNEHRRRYIMVSNNDMGILDTETGTIYTGKGKITINDAAGKLDWEKGISIDDLK